MFNDIHGQKNHLLQIERVKNYTPLAKDGLLEIVEKKKRERKTAVAKENKKQKIR